MINWTHNLATDYNDTSPTQLPGDDNQSKASYLDYPDPPYFKSVDKQSQDINSLTTDIIHKTMFKNHKYKTLKVNYVRFKCSDININRNGNAISEVTKTIAVFM